jgi:diacylglycerol kinase (ATP)
MPPTTYPLPLSADRVLILVNPRAGRRSARHKVDRLARLLGDRAGYDVQICTDLDAACRQANRWHTDGQLRALAAVGGDGTISDVANRIEPGVPLAIFPGGTSNLIARHFRMEPSPEMLYRTITTGRVLCMDVSRVSVSERPNHVGRLFVAMASCGLDAEVVAEVHRHRQRCRGGFLGYWSYVKPILASIRNYRYPEIRVYCDTPGEQGQGKGDWLRVPEVPVPFSPELVQPITARWAFVLNLPRYGWGLPLAPWTNPTDGLLDLCTLRRGSLAMGLVYVAAIQLGMHRRLADCTTRQVRRVRITADAEVEYQLDGDPAGHLPLDIEVVPGRLSMLLPPGPSAFGHQLSES